MTSTRLPRSFYTQPTIQVARDLLGARLIRYKNGQRIGGIIIETEAYCGETDLACHAKAGRTKRTEVMYGPPGHAYVYFTYGAHWLFNTVTRPIGEPEAVLIRAILPTEGLDAIEERRGKQPRKHWTDGPGKLAQALGITGAENRIDLLAENSEITIEKGGKIAEEYVTIGPRVGLYSVLEPWKSKPWRFLASLPTSWEEIINDSEDVL